MIETDRLFLRKFELKDAEAVFAFATHAEVNRYLEDSIPKNIEEAKKIITDVWFSDYEKYGYGRLALVEKASGKVIGFHGFKYLPEFRKADLGYRMLPEYWGKGYATEAGRACLDYGYNEMGLNEVMAMTLIGNEASDHVLKKLGFVETEDSPIENGRVRLYKHIRG